MSEPFIGEIILFAGNFAPKNWAFCNGQIMSIAQNTALFSILGTTYGGNGQTTFGLPDLRGRVPVHSGNSQGPGLDFYTLGQAAGTEDVTLTVNQLPAHSHPGLGVTDAETTNKPGSNTQPARGGAYSSAAPNTTTGPTANAGGSQPHTNIQPYLALNYIICLFGIFPSRN